MKQERVNYVYSDGMEYVSDELLSEILEQLDKLADECLKFSEGLWEDGDKANAHFQKGQGKGIKLAIDKIGEIL
ncbi:hypothetical protein D3C84_1082120 [compost metagenome]